MKRLSRKHRLFLIVMLGFIVLITVMVLALRRTPVPTVPPTISNIPYMSPDDGIRRIDIFMPDQRDGLLPTIVMFHGDIGDKTTLSSVAAHYAMRGYAIVLPTFRIQPVQMNDGYCALGWIVAHAEEYQLDTKRLYLLGYSSGGGIAAELATVHNPVPYMGDCPNLVPKARWTQGVVLYAPSSDRWSGTGWKIDQAPLTWLDGTEPPFYIIHGSSDTLVPEADSQQLAAALKTAGDKVELDIIPDADHRSIVVGFPGNGPVLEAMDHAFEQLRTMK